MELSYRSNRTDPTLPDNPMCSEMQVNLSWARPLKVDLKAEPPKAPKWRCTHEAQNLALAGRAHFSWAAFSFAVSIWKGFSQKKKKKHL